MSEDKTLAQLKKEFEPPSQAEVNYIPLSTTKGKACANCRWLIADDYCYLIANGPETILPTGYCDRWEAKPEPPAEMAEAVAEAVTEAVVSAVETIAESMPVVTMEMEAKPKSLLQRAKEALFPAPEIGDFNVFKDASGVWHWIAKYTNAYEDKDHEIFTEKAHEDYIRRVDMGLIDKPELWVWHTKGTKHGKADTVFGVGRIMVAVGHFDDTPEAQKAIKYYQKHAADIRLSHGANAPKWAVHDGLIEAYNTFEISTLPKGAEANPYTSYEAVKSMQPDPKKMEMVAAVLGTEKAEQLVKETAEFSKSLDEMQVRYKDFAQTGETPAAPTTEAQQQMSVVFVEMVKEQGQIANLLSAMDKKIQATDEIIKSLKAQNAAYETEVKELRATVNAGPRRASADGSTEVDKELADKIKQQAPNGDDKINAGRAMLGLAPLNGGNHA